jgi:hypothetical protein
MRGRSGGGVVVSGSWSSAGPAWPAPAGASLSAVRRLASGPGSPDPIFGGNDNAYVYPTNPIDGFDLDGRCGFGGVPWHRCGADRITDESRGFGQYWHVVRQGRDNLGYGYEHIHAGHVGAGKRSSWSTDREMYADVLETLASGTWTLNRAYVFMVTLTKTKTWYTTSWCGCRTRHRSKFQITLYYDVELKPDGLPLGVRTAYINQLN